jgi:general secretion pathway protein I
MITSKVARGFTLVEVMVALVVVALALPGLFFLLNQQLDTTRYLRDRTHAQWVASNVLADLRLVIARDQQVQTTPLRGEQEQAGRTWYWRLQTEPTELPQTFRVQVDVFDTVDGTTPTESLSTVIAPEVLYFAP